jgi:hypothetical protein
MSSSEKGKERKTNDEIDDSQRDRGGAGFGALRGNALEPVHLSGSVALQQSPWASRTGLFNRLNLQCERERRRPGPRMPDDTQEILFQLSEMVLTRQSQARRLRRLDARSKRRPYRAQIARRRTQVHLDSGVDHDVATRIGLQTLLS